MELDDLKQSWNKQTEEELKPLNNNIMELIHNKSYGPLAVLKDKIKRQIIVFLLVIVTLIYLLFKMPDFFTLINFFIYCLCLLAGFYWTNYKLIGRMQNIDATVKETLEKNINALEKNFKKYFFVSRGYFIITIIVIEVLMHMHSINFETWQSFSIVIRFAVYVLLFIFIYFMGKYIYKSQYGKHIAYLKELLNKIK